MRRPGRESGFDQNIICAIAFMYEKLKRGGNLLPKVWDKKHHLSRKSLSHIVCDKEKFAGYEDEEEEKEEEEEDDIA